MICSNCGNNLAEGSMFCGNCGKKFNIVEVYKTPKPISIVNIVCGAILLIIGFMDIDFDWGLISLVLGCGMLVYGILQILGKSAKVIGILQLIFGCASFGVGAMCNTDYDWAYVAFAGGLAYALSGLFKLLKKTTVMAVLEIVFGAILLIIGFIDVDFDWGISALLAAAACLVSGIIWLVQESKRKKGQQ